MFGFLKEIDCNQKQLISKLEEENKNLKGVLKLQQEHILLLKKMSSEREEGLNSSFKKIEHDVSFLSNESSASSVPQEIMKNNQHIESLGEKLSNYKHKIQKNEVIVYETEIFNPEIPVNFLKYKIIGKGTNIMRYKKIIQSIIGVTLSLREINIRFETIKGKHGENFLIITLTTEIILNNNLLSRIITQLREEIKEIVDKPIDNELPPISIFCVSHHTETQILELLNTSENIRNTKNFLIKETGTSEDNIHEIHFSKINKVDTKIDISLILTSIYPPISVYTSYNKSFKTVHDKLIEKKELNIIKSLGQEIKKKIDSF